MSAACWRTLGIKPTDDKAAIRRAYADKLKALDVDNDVAGFAKLRQARDTALRLAASAATPPPAPIPEPDAAHDEAWDGNEDDWYVGTPAAAPPPGEAMSDPVEPSVETDAQRIETQLRALAALMFPGGEYSDEGFSLADYEQALALVDGLVAEAQAARLEVHHAIDHHLAEMMAQGWPRSAALVERANEEFGWLSESGSLDERPALRFLNVRIRGMRFTEKVQQANHPLHKAWSELARPGSPGMFDRFRANKNDVAKLLGGIRERYPEVESYLNPERVGWWERRAGDNGPGVISWFIRAVAILWLLGTVARVLLPDPDPSGSTESASIAREFVDGYAQTLAEIVGEDDPAALAGDARAFEAGLRTAYFNARDAGEDHAQGQRMALRFARQFALEARRTAEFDELVAINEVQRLWLQSLEAEGRLGEECPMRFASDSGLDSVTLGEDGLAQERALYARLREAGLLAEMPPTGEISASVPAEVVRLTIERSGLSLEEVQAGLGDPDNPQRCRVQLALHDVVLALPGTVPPDLLRVL